MRTKFLLGIFLFPLIAAFGLESKTVHESKALIQRADNMYWLIQLWAFGITMWCFGCRP